MLQKPAIQLKKVSPTHGVVITSRNDDNIENIKDNFKNNLNPLQLRLGITKITTTRTGHLIVNTLDGQDENKIEDALKDNEFLKVERLRKRRPKIIAKHLPEEVTDKNLHETIFQQNGDLGIPRDAFRIIKIFSPRSSEGKTRHAIIEVDGRYRNAFINNRIRIFFTTCYAEDYISVRRCQKCFKFGRGKKICRSKTSNCSFCSVEHIVSEC